MVQEVTKTMCHGGSKRGMNCEGCSKHNLGDNELEFQRKLPEATRGDIYVMVSTQGGKLRGSHEDCPKQCQDRDPSILWRDVYC